MKYIVVLKAAVPADVAGKIAEAHAKAIARRSASADGAFLLFPLAVDSSSPCPSPAGRRREADQRDRK